MTSSPGAAGSGAGGGGGGGAARGEQAGEGCEAWRRRTPQLTPLAVACSLGDAAVVEVLCQWARREKVHIDPTAPLALGQLAPAATPGASPRWDREGEGGGLAAYGDPPMIMAVRGKSSFPAKQLLVETLAKYGFAADVRSPVDSWTPLLSAVELGSLELVTTLVRLGARVSADRQLGFTPLHLACQTSHWLLVPFLTETMRAQYVRVAAWGPSPQYVSINVLDAYGRTALDIALLRYFASSLPLGSYSQKAVDVLREFVHGGQAEDPGVVCGWEVLRVLRLLEALPPSEKGVGVGAQLFGGADSWTGPTTVPESTSTADKGHGQSGKYIEDAGHDAAESCSDLEELLQAVRALVKGGARTQWLAQDLLQPPLRSPAAWPAGHHASAARSSARLDREPRYSPIDPEDYLDRPDGESDCNGVGARVNRYV